MPLKSNPTKPKVAAAPSTKSAPASTGAPTKVIVAKKKAFRFFQEADSQFIFSESTSKWNAIFLITIGGLLLGLGIALVVTGSVKDLEDLIILGSLFMTGSMVFFVLLYVTVCRPLCSRNLVSYEYFEDGSHGDSKARSPQTTDYSYFNSTENLQQIKAATSPTEPALYGYKSADRTYLSTPATAADVYLGGGLDTPPPPRLALPNDPGNRSDPVITMEMEERLERTKEVSDLELL